MATTTHIYTLHIIETDSHLKLTYRSNKFSRLERVKGTITDKMLHEIGRIIPPNVGAVPKWQETYAGKITIEQVVKNKTVFTQYNDAWFSFYKNYSGVKPKHTGADTIALKQIIKYLEDESDNPDEALAVWQVVLHNWKHLDEFHRKNTDLKYINSQLNKILNATRESKADTGKVFTEAVNSDVAKSFEFK